MGACVSKRKVGYGPSEGKIDASHFETIDQIGKGGFAEVHAARHVSSGELVAIKVIAKRRVLIERKKAHNTSSDAEDSTRGSRKSKKATPQFRISTSVFMERRVMEYLNTCECDFLPRLLYAFQDLEALYMVMPFFAGGDLQHLINRLGPLPESYIRFYSAELIIALENLHKKFIVYRDLKPRNVLLTADGHVVLTDFGLCRILTDEPNQTVSGRAGTKGYLAPEALRGEKYQFSVDFFSLGATIYKLATKKLPYGKAEDFKNRTVNFYDIPPGLVAFISDLLTLDSTQRLGCKGRGWAEVKEHAFFRGFDWDTLERREAVPPYIPETETVTSNCPDTFKPSRYDKLAMASGTKLVLTEEQHKLFEGFEYSSLTPGTPLGPQEPTSSEVPELKLKGK